ncbi:MAG: outer membrane lipoprotein carrier protein LolA [Saprospirales bacterium]|nr:outer membrane lipoprotein carrier protein LolA [Saprospirales bacterium]
MRNFLFLVFCFPICVFAQLKGYTLVKDVPSFKKTFAEQSKKVNSIKCDFVQEKNLSVLSEKITSKGTFMFKKQNMARMEYTTPFKYLLIINADKVFIKDDQKSNSFSSKNNKLFENINKIMIDCVQGTALDNKNFTSVISENEKQYLLELVPTIKKMKDYIKKINIFIDKKDFSVNKFDMIDASGDNTTLTFLNKQFNVGVTDANFVGK